MYLFKVSDSRRKLKTWAFDAFYHARAVYIHLHMTDAVNVEVGFTIDFRYCMRDHLSFKWYNVHYCRACVNDAMWSDAQEACSPE
jgi:hypothetical protein